MDARMLRTAVFAVAVLICSASPRSGRAQDRGATLVDTLVASLLAAGPLPSYSVAVGRDGRITFAKAYGWADIEHNVRADTATRYRLASVSKLVTATAVGLLVQEGRLDLDAPLARYVPSFPNADGVTPRLLAGHLAGIAHYQREDSIDQQRLYGSVLEAIHTFDDSPRVGRPGERYTYSTHGFTLLSAVVSAASGAPFLDYLARYVFAPLGMGHAGPDIRPTPPAGMSTLYELRERKLVPVVRPENPSYKWGGGGLVATPSDLVRMGSAYLSGLIEPVVRHQMWTSQRTAAGQVTGVGIGWRIGTDLLGRRIVHHAGGMEGARSVLIVWPDEGLVVATTTNVPAPAFVEATAQVLLAALLHGQPTGAGSVRAAITGKVDTAAAAGRIRLDGPAGSLIAPGVVPAAPAGSDTMRVFHVRDDLWAVATAAGLGPLRLRITADSVSGEVAWTPQFTWRFAGRRER